MGHPADDVLELAGRQHGAIGLGQIRALGCSRAQLRRIVASGVLVRVGPRVYGVADVAPTFERRLRVALLTLGPGAVVSHLAAARLHLLVDVAEPEFTVARSRRNAVCVHRLHATDGLADDDRTEVAGLPCTTLIRTIRDLAASAISTDQLAAIVDRADVAPTDLRGATVARRPSGDHRLAALLGDRRTPVEQCFLEAVRRHGLPRPHRLDRPGPPAFRFADHDVVVTLRPSASDWDAIARATHRALRDAGWPARRAGGRAA